MRNPLPKVNDKKQKEAKPWHLRIPLHVLSQMRLSWNLSSPSTGWSWPQRGLVPMIELISNSNHWRGIITSFRQKRPQPPSCLSKSVITCPHNQVWGAPKPSSFHGTVFFPGVERSRHQGPKACQAEDRKPSTHFYQSLLLTAHWNNSILIKTTWRIGG